MNDDSFMKMAISQAAKCAVRPGSSPAVGAVIVTQENEVFEAHRREVIDDGSQGRHAEYVAIKKAEKAGKSLRGASLYTTLEPCTWHARHSPQISCAERIVQSGIQYVFIGILDPNPIIYEQGVWFLRRANIDVDRFPPTLQKEIEQLNSGFIERQRSDLKQQLCRHEVIKERLKSPKKLKEGEKDRCFPYKLSHLPAPFIDDATRELDLVVVSGVSRYELETCNEIFEPRGSGDARQFVDRNTKNGIQVGESAYNQALVTDLVAEFVRIASLRQFAVTGPEVKGRRRLHLPYTVVTEDILKRHHCVIIPCGDVNPWFTLALTRFEMAYRVKCPVHHEPYDSSERIQDELSGNLYEKQAGADRWAGYILLIPNPWNEKKCVLICGGNKGMGTQAALLRVITALRGEHPLLDTDGFPCRVVKAQYDLTTLMTHESVEF